jgi:flagellar motor switch protein FliN
MENKKDTFNDPLNEIDPVMEDAFSDSKKDVQDINEEIKNTINITEDLLQKENILDIDFPSIENAFQGDSIKTGVFANIPVNISVELGRSSISLKEIFELTEGSIVELDRLVGEPLDLVVNGEIVAKGEVVAVDSNFGLRIKSIVSKTS